MGCYYRSVEVEPGVVIEQRIHGEAPTDMRTEAAIQAVIKAAYNQLKEQDD